MYKNYNCPYFTWKGATKTYYLPRLKSNFTELHKKGEETGRPFPTPIFVLFWKVTFSYTCFRRRSVKLLFFGQAGDMYWLHPFTSWEGAVLERTATLKSEGANTLFVLAFSSTDSVVCIYQNTPTCVFQCINVFLYINFIEN